MISSSTQKTLKLSSGESEYSGIVKGASGGLGMIAMAKDMKQDLKLVIETDSSSAKAMGSRRGLGKVRHIELCELWLQDQVARGRIIVNKIRGDDNFSDSLTKHSSIDRISQSMQMTSQRYAIGRHPIMPAVAGPPSPTLRPTAVPVMNISSDSEEGPISSSRNLKPDRDEES